MIIIDINKRVHLKMQYFKRKTKLTIIALTIIILTLTLCLSTLAKTEVYFSLSDNPQKEIIKNINQAEDFINIAMYIFTDREIAIPLIEARERGVKVRLYLDKDQVDYKYSQSRFLVQKGIKTRVSSNKYIMHNKFAIIDNRILLTGSYNWTFSANHRNDENLMVIDDPEIITRYQNQFEKLWFDKYSPQRTRQLYQIAKVDFLPASPTPAKPEDKLKTYSKTIEAYKQTIRLNPDDAIAHYNLGFAYDQLGFHEEAREAYIQAIRIDPDYAEAHYRLGVDYVILGFRIFAIEAYKQAVRIDPDYAEAHYSLGVAYLLIKDRDSALNEYKILKELDIDLANKLFDLIY
jgi:tetratricopeptide (TPR) repeat protein